ncbi:hypothetical protein [Nocardioides sp. MH1]|uniref:hypothetical protein n=1 Tax=Nocardioides sp. MH1 TaxID=3242490 RepID=UPI003521FE5E
MSTSLEAGQKVHIKLSVDANSPTPPTGSVTLVLLAGPAGGVARVDLSEIWSRTVHYSGGTKTVIGPALQAAQHYKVAMKFHPSDDTFRKCSAAALFAVEAVNDHQHNGGGGPGGLLPDTGGPALLWLLLGVGLVGGGTGSVVYARRRRTVPATV